MYRLSQGTYNPNEGSDNLNDCINCPTGRYGLLTSATSLNNCKICLKNIIQS